MKFHTLKAAIGITGLALLWVVAGAFQDIVIGAGDRAPDFTVVSDKGETIALSDFKGKLLVLNFWATWCGDCVAELRSLEGLQQNFASKGVVVLAISVDEDETRYKQFLARFPVSFTTARNAGRTIPARYGTSLLPETYVIDRSGKVVEKIVASFDFADPGFLARIESRL